jgi:hypothetical protein
MKISEKVKIIDDLIAEVAKLTYDSNGSPQTSVIDDTLSFIRNTLDEKNMVVWIEKINYISWGIPKAHSVEFEQKRISRWHEGKDKFIIALKSIKKEIEQFSADDTKNTSNADNTANNEPVIFLSHSSSDIAYGDILEKYIAGLGVENKQLIYTSHPMHKIPLDEDIYNYLRKNINNKMLMIFLLSDNYFDSPACLNEMGAAWVTRSNYSTVFTPNFNFGNSKYRECVIDKNKMGVVLNGDKLCKSGMIELKDKIISLFGLSIDEKQSSYLIDEFINEISEID